MIDRSCYELGDIRHFLSACLSLYHEIMSDKSRVVEVRLQAATRLEECAHRYLALLHATEFQLELEQLQRLLGDLRSRPQLND